MKRALIALALAAALPLSAQAGELNYNYVEGGYVSSHFVGTDFDGYGLAGSVKFNDNWYGNASYRDVSKSGVSLTESNINLGWRHAMNDKADFIAEVGYINYGLDLGGGLDTNIDGYRVGAGFRGFLGEKFEGTVKAHWTHLSESGFGSTNDFGGGVSGTYHINDTWGITGSYDSVQIDGDSIGTWGLGVRASF